MPSQITSNNSSQNAGYVTNNTHKVVNQSMPIGQALQNVHNLSTQPPVIKIQECITKERKLLAHGSIYSGKPQEYLKPSISDEINAHLTRLNSAQKITEKSAQTTVTNFTGMAVVAEILRWVSSVALLAARDTPKNLNSLAYNKNTGQLFSNTPEEGLKPLYHDTKNGYTYDRNSAKDPDQIAGYGKLQKNPQWTPEVQAIFIGDRLLLGTNARDDNPDLGNMIKKLLQNPSALEQQLTSEIENKIWHLQLCNKHIELNNLNKKLKDINTQLADKRQKLSYAKACTSNPNILKRDKEKHKKDIEVFNQDIKNLENQRKPLAAQSKEILASNQIDVFAPPPTEQEAIKIQEDIRQLTQAKNHLRQLSNFARNSMTESEWINSARTEYNGQILGEEKKELEAQLTVKMLLGIQRALSKEGTITVAGQPTIGNRLIEGMVHAEQRLAEYIQSNQENIYNNFLKSLDPATIPEQDQRIPLPFAGTKPACTICDATFNNRNLKAQQEENQQQSNTSPYFTMLTFGDRVLDKNSNPTVSVGKSYPDSYAPYELFINCKTSPNSDISRAFCSPQKKTGLSALVASENKSSYVMPHTNNQLDLINVQSKAV